MNALAPMREAFDVRADKQWLTAAEAAAEALPDFPATKRQINRIIADNHFATRKRCGRGGGREFHWTQLPAAARAEYLKRHGVLQNAVHEAGRDVRATSRDLIAEARALIVGAADAFIADRAHTKAKGLKSFSAAYKNRRVKLDDWVFRTVASVEPHQLRTWSRLLKTGGMKALTDKRGRPKASGFLHRETELRNYIVAVIAERPHLTAKQILLAIRADLNREIALRTLQAFLAEFRSANKPALLALSDPDRHRSHCKPAFGSLSAKAERINQLWELDATRADVMCRMQDGSTIRYALTGIIDVFTRRAIVLVSDQPCAAATQALLRRAILAWGLPETIKSDNGKEFIAGAVRRFCDDLGIRLEFSRPFTPEQKGHIERFFGTLNHQLLPMLPGFVGANVAERKAIESRASFSHRFGTEARIRIETELAPSELQARIDAWLRDAYEQNHHAGIALRPVDKALAHADDVKRLPDERALDALLFDAPDASGMRIVGKKGIAIRRRFYIAAELGGLVGYQVHVRWDAHDPSRIVVYSKDRKEFLCVAVDPDAVPVDRIKIAAAAQSEQRKVVGRIRADARKVLQLYPSNNLGDRILQNAGGEGFVLEAESARAMHAAERPALIAARAGLDALAESDRPPQPIEPTADEREAAAAFVAENSVVAFPAPQSVQCDGYTRPLFDDDCDFVEWAREFIADGGALDRDDQKLLAEYASSETIQLQLRMRAAARNNP